MKVMACFEEICTIASTGGDKKCHVCEPKLDMVKCWIGSLINKFKTVKIRAATRSNCTI